MTNPLFLGVDVGTGGVRALATTADGGVVARTHTDFPPLPDGPEQEQDPRRWWEGLAASVSSLGECRRDAAAIAISCTSGSVCAVTAENEPVGPGLLYSDRRAITTVGDDESWARAKVRWLAEHRPDLVARAHRFTSPGGYLAGRLLGGIAPIDDTQALKFGFDPETERWEEPPVPTAMFPPVARTGTALGAVDPAAARELGLPDDVVVVAGATDGVAAQFACRPAPDRWVVTIGSTIVWKTMAPVRIRVPDRGIYSHRGPDGWWLPGAASNAGARILATWASPADLDRFATAVLDPHTAPAYPSVLRGERFPFRDPDFEPWPAPAEAGVDRYAAESVGLALVEKWGCDVLVEHGAPQPSVVVTTGGAVASRSFRTLRAAVLGCPVEMPAEPSSAFGAAVIAAGPSHGGVVTAGSAMVRIADRIDPPDSADWGPTMSAFRSACRPERVGPA